MIDLRSDTITKPSDTMRRAMATAEVGDDVFGDDPAFYSYTAPKPDGLENEPLQPETAFWTSDGGMALLMLDDPRLAVPEFLESTYQSGTKVGDWDASAFELRLL